MARTIKKANASSKTGNGSSANKSKQSSNRKQSQDVN